MNASTGREVWRSGRGDFTSWPGVCPDAGRFVCVTGEASLLRVGIGTGSPRQVVRFSTSSAGRVIGAGLFDPALRHPEQLVSVRGTRIAWREPLANVFNRAGASTDWGWNFDRYNRLGLFIGSTGLPPIKQTSTFVAFDLSHAMTAAFRINDGRPVWRSAGTQYVCSYLLCPGQAFASFSSPAGLAAEPRVGIRLRSTGTVSGNPKAASLPTASPGSRVTIEGFEPKTGKTIWTYDAGHDPQLIEQTLLPPQIRPTAIALPAAHGYVQLDLTTGAHRRISPATRAWCRRISQYKQATPYQTGNGISITTYVAQYGLTPCTASGKPTAPPTTIPRFVAQIGARASGYTAWTSSSGITART